MRISLHQHTTDSHGSTVDNLHIGDRSSEMLATHTSGIKSIATLWRDGKAELLLSTQSTGMAFAPLEVLLSCCPI